MKFKGNKKIRILRIRIVRTGALRSYWVKCQVVLSTEWEQLYEYLTYYNFKTYYNSIEIYRSNETRYMGAIRTGRSPEIFCHRL